METTLSLFLLSLIEECRPRVRSEFHAEVEIHTEVPPPPNRFVTSHQYILYLSSYMFLSQAASGTTHHTVARKKVKFSPVVTTVSV
jgi:hypothetical protein